MSRLSMLLLIVAHLYGICDDTVKACVHDGAWIASDYLNALYTEGMPAYRVTISTVGHYGDGDNKYCPVSVCGIGYSVGIDNFIVQKYIPTPSSIPIPSTNLVFSFSNPRGFSTNSTVIVVMEFSKAKDLEGNVATFDTSIFIQKLHPLKTTVENATVTTSPYMIGGDGPWTNYNRTITFSWTVPTPENRTNFLYQGYTTEVH